MSNGPTNTHTIHFISQEKKLKSLPGESILVIARKAGISVGQQCGGKGLCGKCRIRIVTGPCSEATEREEKVITKTDLTDGMRLACQTRPLGNLVVEVKTASDEQREGQTFAESLDIFKDNSFKKTVTDIPVPSLEDNLDDMRRLKQVFGLKFDSSPEIDYLVLESLPKPGSGVWPVQVISRGRRILSITEPGVVKAGFAADIGSTKIAGFLIDPDTGRILASGSRDNPQIAYGTDIITRLAFAAQKRENLSTLKDVTAHAIAELAVSLTRRIGLETDAVIDAVFVGNTAMQHLLLGLNPDRLIASPFIPVVSESVRVSSREFGLPFAPGCSCSILPNVGGFIGSDHIAMLLAVEERIDAKKTVLCIDVGTNTEICLSSNGTLSSTSAPSGPAFEGWHIKQGMRADPGAIDSVSISRDNIHFTVIGDGEPKGLCGSGIVDAVASLYRAGLIDFRGRLGNHPRIKSTEHGKAYPLCSTVSIFQKDIGEFMLAKGAIAAGIDLLLEKMGLQIENVEEVIIAGAFGVHINPESAMAVGLFPPLPLSCYFFAGNAAGAGAVKALLSEKACTRAENLSREIRYFELAAEPSFKSAYIRKSFFPKK